MRRILILTLGAALLTTTALVAHNAAAGSPRPTPAAFTGTPADEHAAERGLPITRPATARLPLDPAPATPAGGPDPLAVQLARARLATGGYATNLGAARADGYQLLTRMIPDMGWHFRNPTIQGFDVRRPPILVYERHRGRWQLAALEWVFPQTPTSPPLPGATYGSFPAACHYRDGTLVVARVQALCPTRSPSTGARFSFWHPDLVTLHVWLWYHNPAGLYSATNPLVRPFNHT